MLCRHEMNPSWCAICLGQVKTSGELPDDSSVSSPFPAQYRRWCEACENKIFPGDMVCLVKLSPDDDGDIVHEECT